MPYERRYAAICNYESHFIQAIQDLGYAHPPPLLRIMADSERVRPRNPPPPIAPNPEDTERWVPPAEEPRANENALPMDEEENIMDTQFQKEQ